MSDTDQISSMNAIHRCGNCGKFSKTDGSIEATCEHCGTYLEPAEVETKNKYEEEKRQAELKHEHPVFWVNVKPEDGAIRKGFVRSIQAAQLAYMGIVSLLLWIVAAVAG
jgi:predicted  nucleic acid-binding Zn-ribbon protein